jgi:hypothetical protein
MTYCRDLLLTVRDIVLVVKKDSNETARNFT